MVFRCMQFSRYKVYGAIRRFNGQKQVYLFLIIGAADHNVPSRDFSKLCFGKCTVHTSALPYVLLYHRTIYINSFRR